MPPLGADTWKAGAAAILASMTPEGQRRALRQWAKLGARAGGPFCPELPAPPVLADCPPEVMGLLADFTVLDLEFQRPGDHLFQLAAIRYQQWRETRRYSSYVHFTGLINRYVTDVTGITLNTLRGAPSEKKVLQAFFELAGDSVLVCHNISADRNVLESARRRQGAKADLPNKWLCTMALAKRRLPKGAPCGLGELCQRFSIDASDAHDAERDAEMCYQVLRQFHLTQPITELITSSAQPKNAGTGNLFAAAA